MKFEPANPKTKENQMNNFNIAIFDELLSRGLCSGLGAGDGQVCVEQAISLACGEDPTDQPTCALAASSSFAVRLNDSRWSSPTARAAGMRGLALAQIGTSRLDKHEFVRRLAEAVTREIVPAALRVAAKRNPVHAERLEAAARRCETEGTEQAARDAQKIASDAAYAAADAAGVAACAADAAVYVAKCGASPAVTAEYAGGRAAAAAAYAADAAADADYAAAAAAGRAARSAADAARDQALTRAANVAARILTEMREERAI